MDYVKLYVTLRDDPKTIGLSDAAFRAYVNALCWSGEHETDGALPEGMVKSKLKSELQSAGLMDGLTIHNWAKRQRTRAELEALRAERRESGRRGGQAKALALAKQTVSKLPSKNVAELEVEVRSKNNQEPKATSLSVPDDFEAFYAAFPVARKGARRPVRKAWVAAIRRGVLPMEMLAGAMRYRDDPNRLDEFTSGAAAWLNRDGWEDAPLPSRNGHREESVDERLHRLGIE